MAVQEVYRRNAAACLRLAQEAAKPDRSVLLEMAATWLRLADRANNRAARLVNPMLHPRWADRHPN